MATVATTSKKFSLVLNDFWKGLIVATLTTPITALYTSLQAGKFTIDWKQEGAMAVIGLLGYLIKNFLTPAQTVITGIPVGTSTLVTIPAAGESAPIPPTVVSTPPEPKKAA
ncbi:MAG TPA: hypothetical protein VGZ90_13700 [Puia sp.]|jgi:hypothetical protein|nr:hypothetical protein [Puia sp.]